MAKKIIPDKKATQRFIERAGGPAAVGRMFKPEITSQAVSQWVKVPAERCLTIEKESQGKVTRYQLRPDVYGDAEPKRKKAA